MPRVRSTLNASSTAGSCAPRRWSGSFEASRGGGQGGWYGWQHVAQQPMKQVARDRERMGRSRQRSRRCIKPRYEALAKCTCPCLRPASACGSRPARLPDARRRQPPACRRMGQQSGGDPLLQQDDRWHQERTGQPHCRQHAAPGSSRTCSAVVSGDSSSAYTCKRDDQAQEVRKRGGYITARTASDGQRRRSAQRAADALRGMRAAYGTFLRSSPGANLPVNVVD